MKFEVFVVIWTQNLLYMRKLIPFLFLLMLTMTDMSALKAQALTLPQTSPREHIRQTVGLTTLELDFSRPSVRGRKIFGGLLPYDSVWRVGANAATTLEISDDIQIEGQKLAKGKYALFVKPGKNQWTLLINRNPEIWGTEYRASETMLKLTTKTQNTEFTESLMINFDNLRNDSATLVIRWENTMARFPLAVPTNDKALENIKNATQGTSGIYSQAANYLLMNGGDLKTAMDYANKSISLEEGFYNNWVKAQILAKQGNYKDAATYINKAVEMGKASGSNSSYRFYSERIENAAKEYTDKAGSKKKSK
jgi:tetratricopeptide (TPR) repeat protein